MMILFIILLFFPYGATLGLSNIEVGLNLTVSIQNDTKPKIVLFQGTVNSIQNCIQLDITNTTECTILCAKNQSCLLTVMRHKECIHCQYGKISSVTRESSGTYIGLKVSNGFEYLVQKSSFLNFPISSLLSLFNPTSGKNQGMCPYGTTSLKTCETGWEMFRRGKIWWCLKVLTSARNMKQANGVEICKNEKAILSGLETMEEARFVNETSQNLMRAAILPKYNPNGWGIWISGVRKISCRRPKNLCEKQWNIPDKCVGVKGFDIADQTLKTFSGYDWQSGEPNDSACAQDCVLMTITRMEKYLSRNGKLDDVGCASTNAIFDIRGVLCGKEAE